MKIAEKILDLFEMARVATNGLFSIWVYSEPLGNPSFHVKKGNDYEVVLQIKDLNILEWKKRENTKQRNIPREDKIEIYNILVAQSKRGIVNWFRLLDQWDGINYKYEIGDLPIPSLEEFLGVPDK